MIETQATIPAKDLQPLYTVIQDCRECAQKLSAAEANAVEDKAKIAALEKERNQAVSTAKGGGGRQKLRRECFWFVLGSVAGASLANAFQHRR